MGCKTTTNAKKYFCVTAHMSNRIKDVKQENKKTAVDFSNLKTCGCVPLRKTGMFPSFKSHKKNH